MSGSIDNEEDTSLELELAEPERGQVEEEVDLGAEEPQPQPQPEIPVDPPQPELKVSRVVLGNSAPERAINPSETTVTAENYCRLKGLIKRGIARGFLSYCARNNLQRQTMAAWEVTWAEFQNRPVK
jgi:hypothetical protein